MSTATRAWLHGTTAPGNSGCTMSPHSLFGLRAKWRGRSTLGRRPAGALRELAANSGEMFRIRCLYDGPEAVQVRDEAGALHLYRIAQEAISNAVRHGAAREVEIRLQSHEDHISMLIRDDGCGIP